jgi:hypothetical protein
MLVLRSNLDQVLLRPSHGSAKLLASESLQSLPNNQTLIRFTHPAPFWPGVLF